MCSASMEPASSKRPASLPSSHFLDHFSVPSCQHQEHYNQTHRKQFCRDQRCPEYWSARPRSDDHKCDSKTCCNAEPPKYVVGHVRLEHAGAHRCVGGKLAIENEIQIREGPERCQPDSEQNCLCNLHTPSFLRLYSID